MWKNAEILNFKEGHYLSIGKICSFFCPFLTLGHQFGNKD